MRKDRTDDILDAAVELAEEGGFDNVRQREVAARAGVALGTLYARFHSKEELLSAALARRAQGFQQRCEKTPAAGATPEERLASFFAQATREHCRKPHYGRAVLRAMASGVPEVAARVVAYQGLMAGLVIAAIRGAPSSQEAPSDQEQLLTFLLLQIWFSTLVGWSAGLFTVDGACAHMARVVAAITPAVLTNGSNSPRQTGII